MTGFTVRRATVVDFPVLARIAFAHREGIGGMILPTRFRQLIDCPRHDLFVAEGAPGVIHAFGLQRQDETGVSLMATAAHPQHRVRGAARAVTMARLDAARDRGADRVRGWVLRSNAPRVLGFWLAMGFAPDEERSTERAIHIEHRLTAEVMLPAPPA